MRSWRKERLSPKRSSKFAGVFSLLIACCLQTAALEAEPVETTEVILETVNIGAVKAQTGGLLLSGQAGGNVDGALVWTLSNRDDHGRVEVPFAVEVDGRVLLGGRRERRIPLGFYAYVVGDNGRVVAHTAEGLVLDPALHRERVLDSGLKYVGRFVLEAGIYTLRVMVENYATGEYFMSWSSLVVPPAEDPEPHLLPPLFPDREDPWVLVRQSGGGTTFPLGNSVEFLPAGSAMLVENQPTEIYLGGGGWDSSALVEIRLLNEVGRVVFEPAVKFSDPAAGAFEFQRVELPPVDVPPGDYTMIVTLADEQANEMLRRAARLKVVREGERRGHPGAGDSALTQDSIGEAGPSGTSPKISKKEIRAAYRDALGPLSLGDWTQTRRMVADLERRAIEGGSRNFVPALGEAELAEAMVLAKVDPDSLAPLALLHRDLYRGYVARRDGLLASHSRKMAIIFAEQLGRAKPLNGFSGGLMVNLASDLAQSGASSVAREILERALELNPEDRSAMLFLGFSFERASEYLEASFAYQRLVSAHPDFDEGRLRLAVNLLRTGRSGSGIEILRDLLQLGSKPWIEAIAAQELVRQSIEKGRSGEAERQARSALERMPDDQRLWILLASILEQTGRHSEAVEIMIDLPPASRGVSPRARYGEWPALGFDASQAHLSAMAEDAAPALGAALAARGGGR